MLRLKKTASVTKKKYFLYLSRFSEFIAIVHDSTLQQFVHETKVYVDYTGRESALELTIRL